MYSYIEILVFQDRLEILNEKIIYRNLERNTLKLERNKSYLMFNETCYNNIKISIKIY